MSNDLRDLILYIDKKIEWEDWMDNYITKDEGLTEQEIIERWNNAHTPMDIGDDSE